MPQKTEDIIQHALSRIKHGESISSVVFSYPASVRDEITYAAHIASVMKSMARCDIPLPMKRRLYADIRADVRAQPVRSVLAGIFAFRKVTAGIATFLLVAGATAYAAANSLPGDALFGLKKAYEITRVHFAKNPENKVRFEINLANQRLQDAQRVLAENSDPAAQSAAIQELNSQTRTTLSHIKEAASANPSAAKDSSLINSAESITKAQQQLLTNNAQNTAAVPASTATQQTLAQNQQTLQDIKQIVAAATNEQSTASLPHPVDFDNTGPISAIQNYTITVGGVAYSINDGTVIANKAGTKLSYISLNIYDVVEVKGQLIQGKNVVQNLIVITRVKSEKAAVPSSGQATQPGTQADTQSQPKQTSQDPQDTIGTFIPETPASNGIY